MSRAGQSEQLGGPNNRPDRPERPVEAATQASDIMPAKSLSTPITDCHATTEQLGPLAQHLVGSAIAALHRVPVLPAKECLWARGLLPAELDKPSPLAHPEQDRRERRERQIKSQP